MLPFAPLSASGAVIVVNDLFDPGLVTDESACQRRGLRNDRDLTVVAALSDQAEVVDVPDQVPNASELQQDRSAWSMVLGGAHEAGSKIKRVFCLALLRFTQRTHRGFAVIDVCE